MSQKDIGRFIADSRKNKGLTQHGLAELLGVTNKAVSKWETGKGMPDVGILPALCAVLGVSADKLLAGKPAPAQEGGKKQPRPLFTLEFEVGRARMNRGCRLAQRTLSKLPRALFAVCVFFIMLIFAAMFVSRLWLGSPAALWALLAALAGGMALCALGYRWRAARLWERYGRDNGDNRGFALCFFEDGFEARSHTSTAAYHYGDISAIAREGDSLLLRCRGSELYMEQADLQNGTMEELLAFLRARAPGAKYIPSDPRRRIQLLAALLLGSAAGCLLIMQIGYLTLGRAHRFEYLYDWLLFLFNAVILLLFLGAALLLWHKRARTVLPICIAAALLLCGNLYLGSISQNCPQQTVTSTSPSGLRFIVKIDPTTGRANLCRPSFLWFVRPKDTLPHPVSGGNVRTQWLADDVCMVNYLSPYSGVTQAYVATYGDRSSGPSHESVTSALQTGNWVAPRSMREWTFESGEGGYTLSNFEKTEFFPYGDCMAYGTTALVLYKEGTARWVVALGTDSVMDGGVLQGGGSMVVCPVSMDETAPIPFTNGYSGSHFEAME